MAIEKKIGKFCEDLEDDKQGRYRSWEYCYSRFCDARKKRKEKEPDYDYLSLNLAFYLASWGMYRGSSFLLQKDYTVHKEVVKKILEKDYDELEGFDWVILVENNHPINNPKYEENLGKLKKLGDEIEKIYKPIKAAVDKKRKAKEDETEKEETTQTNNQEDGVAEEISKTLITKILMGTLGCVPAYDRFFTDAVKKYEYKPEESKIQGTYNVDRSIPQLVEFYKENWDDLEPIREKMNEERRDGLEYPQMKILDMGFWQIGYDLANP